MIASLILMLAFIPLYKMFQGGAKRARFQKIRAYASSLAQNYIERVRGCSLYYLDEDGPKYEASDDPAIAHGHFLTDLESGFTVNDPVLVPTPDSPGVPPDDEMRDLLQRWAKRATLFKTVPARISPEMSPSLAPMNMRILAVSIYWGQDKLPRPLTLEELRNGKDGKRYNSSESLTLATLMGEGLFHPPPTIEP